MPFSSRSRCLANLDISFHCSAFRPSSFLGQSMTISSPMACSSSSVRASASRCMASMNESSGSFVPPMRFACLRFSSRLRFAGVVNSFPESW